MTNNDADQLYYRPTVIQVILMYGGHTDIWQMHGRYIDILGCVDVWGCIDVGRCMDIWGHTDVWGI